MTNNDNEWRHMDAAPKDGRRLRVLVGGASHGDIHELPYDVRWYQGRWCYALYDTPLYQWHAPMGWKRPEPLRVVAR